MTRIIVFLFLATLVPASAQTPAQTGKRSFTFEDMMALKRISDPVPSPDGKWVLFSAVEVNIEENTRKSRLWIVPASGGEARRLNPTENEEERPRFSPDGKRLIFSSKATDPSQIWIVDFDANSGALAGQPQQLTLFRRARRAASGRRMGRTFCSSRRFIRIAKGTRAISGATKN